MGTEGVAEKGVGGVAGILKSLLALVDRNAETIRISRSFC